MNLKLHRPTLELSNLYFIEKKSPLNYEIVRLSSKIFTIADVGVVLKVQ